MEQLRAYLKTLSTAEQEAFAARCGTTIGYLRKALSTGKPIGAEIVMLLERESGAAISCEDVRPDIDWAYLRGSRLRADTPRPTA